MSDMRSAEDVAREIPWPTRPSDIDPTRAVMADIIRARDAEVRADERAKVAAEAAEFCSRSRPCVSTVDGE